MVSPRHAFFVLVVASRLCVAAPDEAAALIERGVAAERSRDYEAAIVAFDKAIALNPKAAAAYANRGVCRANLGRHAEALADFDKALEFAPNDPRILRDRERCVNQQRLAKVADDFAKGIPVVASEPLPPPFVPAPRHDNFLPGSPPAGPLKNLLSLTEQLRVAPQDAALYVARGRALQMLGDLVGAVGDFTKAIQLDPQRVDAYVGRAAVRRLGSHPESALGDAKHALQLDPRSAYAHAELGWVHYVLLHLPEAQAEFTAALQIDPACSQALLGRGELLALQGDLTGAAADLLKASLRREPIGEANRRLGIVRLEQGKWASAYDEFVAARKNLLSDRFLPLYAYVALARDGKANPRGLSELGNVFDAPGAPQDWAYRLAQLLMGRLTDTALVNYADKEKGGDSRERRGEAFYFIGLARLLRNEKPLAASNFRLCLSLEKKTMPEYRLARAELARLEAKPESKPAPKPPVRRFKAGP
jgi:tetratricopeptide (TPR) repeat protein